MCTCPFVLFSDNPSPLVDHQCSWSHASSNFTSCNRTSSLFRYLHFNATSAENPLSQAHVMRNVGGLFTRLSDISGFWEWARRESAGRFVCRSVLKNCHKKALLLCPFILMSDLTVPLGQLSHSVFYSSHFLAQNRKSLVKFHLEELRMFTKWLRHFRRV